MIILYSKEDCQPCKAVKRWLDSKGAEYEVRGPDEAIAAGYRSVPVAVKGTKEVFGFDISGLAGLTGDG